MDKSINSIETITRITFFLFKKIPERPMKNIKIGTIENVKKSIFNIENFCLNKCKCLMKAV